MIVVCDKCSKKYNVDDAKIPDEGIKVRCAQCGNILFIKKAEPVAEIAQVEEKTEVEESVHTEEEEGSEPTSTEVEKETEVAVEERVEEGTTEDKGEELRTRAKRLARALAKDLILYHGEKVEKGLKEGTLAQLIGGEIKRSWEYYCQQIPKEIRLEFDYFKEALNEIIGKGKAIFK
ncbi:MAG TPA: hypothetical protein EYP58_06055 [bacterium (Candidatus Stahlbacteria)]|nr:hypothetical protein [Candidatus Stahlbacteria bacterium]